MTGIAGANHADGPADGEVCSCFGCNNSRTVGLGS
jgi:hypothetical protein